MYSFQGYHFQGFNHVPLFHDVPVSLRLVPLLAIRHQRCKFIPGQAPEVHCPIYLFFSFYPVHSSCSFDSNQTASTSCIPPLCPDSGLSRAWRRNVFHLMQGCRMQSCNSEASLRLTSSIWEGIWGFCLLELLQCSSCIAGWQLHSKTVNIKMFPSASERTSYWGTQNSQRFIC